MNILPISDIHGKDEILYWIIDNINPELYDLVTVSGDLWEGGSLDKREVWVEFQKQINKPIVMILGNHDYTDASVFDDVDNIHLLHNESIEIDGVLFYGTPYTVRFCNWNWMSSEEELYEAWSKGIPDKLDVLLSHGPPHGYCDNCNQPVYGNTVDSTIGSASLRKVIEEKDIKYVFCGHIHTGDRVRAMECGTKVYNVSCVDESYKFGGHNPTPSVVKLELGD